MPPLPRRWRAIRPALAALLFATLSTAPAISSSAPAAASPQGDLAAKQAEAARIQAQIDANGERISVLDEQYNQTQLKIDQAAQGIKDTQARLDAAAQHTDQLKSRLAERAAALYVGAAGGSPASALDVKDVVEIGSRSKYGSAAADEDSGLIDDLVVAKEQLQGAQDEFQKSKAAAESEKAGLDKTRSSIAAAQDEQQQLLSSAQGEIKTLVDKIAAQKRAADEAKARAAAQQRGRTSARSTSTGGRSHRGSPSLTPNVAPAPNGGAATAVATAMAQLGKPYRYAAAGPGSFDCSGLTMFAWAAAGVRLPHSSAAQYASLPHVSQDQLAPGDLVFYGHPIHHVGMYIGNGQYVHAPQTGDVVKVASAFRSDYVGAARP
jgi:cell wall-associated NlpC family hydrolase